MFRRVVLGSVGVLLLGLSTLCLACGPPRENAAALTAGYQQLYNLDFAAADRTLRAWTDAHPDDPMSAVSHATVALFAELERRHLLALEFFVDDARFFQERPAPEPALATTILNTLEVSIAHSDRVLMQQPLDSNALLAKIFALGLRAGYHTLLTQQYLTSLADMKASRLVAEQLLAARPECADASLAIGVENTFLSWRPAVLRWLLRLRGAQTDHDVGLAALQHTATQGQYLRPYAKFLLAAAALRDGQRARARELLTELAQEFPHNHLYATEQARLR